MAKNKHTFLICLLLTAATLAVYLQVGSHGFINFDDDVYITANSHIRDGITIDGLRWAFATGRAGNYHPLTWVSHMLDVQLFGLQPRRHHLVSLLFHVANVLLLFFALNRMTKAPWRSAFVAALFALHPLHVESVAWASERKDVLSTFFWMLTLVAYGYYAERPRLGNRLAVIAFFALGLMAKPMLVTLPFVLLLLDYWPLERFAQSRAAPVVPSPPNASAPARTKKHKAQKQAPKIPARAKEPLNNELQWKRIRPLVLEKIPLFALTALSCVVTYIAQKGSDAIAPTEIFPLGMRTANALVSYLLYTAKTIWPAHLAVFYPYPASLPAWQVLAAALFLAAVTLAVLHRAARSPYLAVGWLWFTGTLVPVIGIVQVGSQAMADRYTYIPSIGLFIVAAWSIPDLLGGRRHAKELPAVFSVFCLLCLSILTWKQVGYWRDNVALYDHTLEVTKDNWLMLNNRGNALRSIGNDRGAVEDFTRVIELNPQFEQAYRNRGNAYNDMGDYVHAVEDFEKAIQINPESAPAYGNLGVAYAALGNNERALEAYGRAIGIDPAYPDAYYNRGVFYQSLRAYDRAIADYDKAVEYDFPNLVEAFCNRGAAYAQLHDQPKAIENFDMAIAVNPGYAKAYFNRGISHEELGQHMQAIRDYDKAIELNPEYPKAYFNRGMTYDILGNKNQAIEDMKKAVSLGSENAANFLKSRGID